MPRTRKSLDQKLADLTQKQEQLEAQRQNLLASKKSAERKSDARRKIIVGAAVLAHAELYPDFTAILRGVLSAAVQRPIDRRAIADLLGDPPPDDPVIPQSSLDQKQAEV